MRFLPRNKTNPAAVAPSIDPTRLPDFPVDTEELGSMVADPRPIGIDEDNHAEAKQLYRSFNPLIRQWEDLYHRAGRELQESQQAIDTARAELKPVSTSGQRSVASLEAERAEIGRRLVKSAGIAGLDRIKKPVGKEELLDEIRALKGLPKKKQGWLSRFFGGDVTLFILKLVLICMMTLALGQITHAIEFHNLIRGTEGMKEARADFWFYPLGALAIVQIIAKWWYDRGYAEGRAALSSSSKSKRAEAVEEARQEHQLQTNGGYAFQAALEIVGVLMTTYGYNVYRKQAGDEPLPTILFVILPIAILAISWTCIIAYAKAGKTAATAGNAEKDAKKEINTFLAEHPAAVEAVEAAVDYDAIAVAIDAARKAEKEAAASARLAKEEASKIPTRATMAPETADAFTALRSQLIKIADQIRELMTPTSGLDEIPSLGLEEGASSGFDLDLHLKNRGKNNP